MKKKKLLRRKRIRHTLRKRPPKRARRTEKRSKSPGPDKSEEILCAGFGGQGILFMGKLLAQAGLIDSMRVTWMPSYGAEVRGGTAHSMTRISTKEIPNPVITRPTICIVMNKPSLVKFIDTVKEGGFLLVNKTLVGAFPKRKDLSTISLPLTDMASKIGNIKAANMVAIGALIKKTRLFSMKTVLAALACLLKDKGDDFLAINKKALEAGFRGVK